MPSTGATLPGVGTTSGTGGGTWTNPGNITADDTTNAALGNGTGETQHLVARQFGFGISAASIDGLTVTVRAKYTGFVAQNLTAQIRNASGTLVGSTKVNLVNTTGLSTFTYGGSADVWSTSLTQTDINDIDFGIEFWVDNGAGLSTYGIDIDWVKIDVTYTSSGGTGTRSYFNWFYGGMGAAGGVTPSTKPWYFRKYVLGRRG